MYDYNYNATRKPLILKEYGRNVQELVEAMSTIEEKDERTRYAHDILRLMTTLDASNRNNTENIQRHWDNLFIISNYTLDVDSPYPIPEKPIFTAKSQRPPYNSQPIRFKNYGRNIERLVQKAIGVEDQELQEQMVIYIVKLMKNFSNEWNNDNIGGGTLLANIQKIAGNKLTVDFEKLKMHSIFSTTHRKKSRGPKTARNTEKKRKTS